MVNLLKTATFLNGISRQLSRRDLVGPLPTNDRARERLALSYPELRRGNSCLTASSRLSLTEGVGLYFWAYQNVANAKCYQRDERCEYGWTDPPRGSVRHGGSYQHNCYN